MTWRDFSIVTGILLSIGLLGGGLAVMHGPYEPPKTIHIVDYHPGGSLEKELKTFGDMARNGDFVVVNGPCISACTLLLGAFDWDRVCATDSGDFYFHEVSAGPNFAPAITEWVYKFFPPKISELLAEKGWDMQSKVSPKDFPEGLVHVTPIELGVQSCGEVEWAGAVS